MTELFDPDAEYDARSTDELADLAYGSRRPIGTRARAVTALGRRAADADVTNRLTAIARDESMRDARMFELVSLAYLAVAGLVHAGSAPALAAARDSVATFPAGDRTSLLAFLRSGDLVLDAPEQPTA